MELPVLFTDYTRNLLGDEDYMRLTAALEAEQYLAALEDNCSIEKK